MAATGIETFATELHPTHGMLKTSMIRLDPPLDLPHMPPSPLRARLTELRRLISRD